MKTVERMAAQGDVVFRRIEALPKGLKKSKDMVVAHSETGHNHVIDGKVAQVLRGENPMVCYLQLTESADVVHHRPWDTHETLRLAPGTWEVRRQREWTPEGWRRVED
jgi:hypothetical protein